MRCVPPSVLRAFPARARVHHTRRTHVVVLAAALPFLCTCASGDLPKGADSQAPTIRIIQPSEGTRIEGDSLTIDVQYADQGSGVSVNSLKVLLNGRDVSGSFDQHSRGATGRISTAHRLQLGENKLKVELADRAGNVGRAEISFLYPGSGWLTLTAVLPGQARGIKSLAFSGDGNVLASGSDDGGIRPWDLSGPKPQDRPVIKSHRKSVTSLAFSPDGQLLASGGEDGTVRLWTVKDSRPIRKTVLRGHWRGVVALAFAPDGQILVSGGKDGTVRLWNLAESDPKEAAVLEGHRLDVFSVTFTSDGRTLASSGWDQTVRLWNIEGAEQKERAVVKGHNLTVSSVAFTRDGNTLAMGTDDATVRLWSLSGSEPIERAVLEGHGEKTWVLAFSADGQSLISIGNDGQVILWDTRARTKTGEATVPGNVLSVAATADGRSLAIGYDNGTIYVLRGGDNTRRP